MNRRIKSGLLLIAISVSISLALGLLFSVIETEKLSFAERAWLFSNTMFFYFGAPGVIGGILICVTKLKDDHCIGFGIALYYGTAVLSEILKRYISATEQNRLFISFVIVALVCYVFWNEKFREDDQQ